MKVNYQKNENISYKGFYNNRFFKKTLEFAANNGTLFAATTTLALSCIRPLAIMATPNADKKNKQIASAKSITSSLNGYLIALVCSLPMAKAIKRIDTNPQKYLNKDTIKTLKNKSKVLTESKSYILATQLFKLGLGFIIAMPKAFLTALETPYILSLLNKNSQSSENTDTINKDITFKGKNIFSQKIGKIINKENFKKFVTKYQDSNFPMHIVAATDALSTATFVAQFSKSKSFDKEEKAPLIYNSIISTTLSILSTYLIDYLTKEKTNKFIEKFKEINKNDPKVSKQIEGIKIIKPMLIAGCVYYILIPIISTFFAERMSKQAYSSKDKPSSSVASSINL